MRVAFLFILTPVLIAVLLFLTSPLHSQQIAEADTIMNAGKRNAIIDSVISNLNRFYVFPETAKEIEKQIRLKQRKKEYDRYISAAAFTTALTTDLRSISRDKHLSVNFSEKVLS